MENTKENVITPDGHTVTGSPNVTEKLTKANGLSNGVRYIDRDRNIKLNGDATCKKPLNPPKKSTTATVPTNIAIPPDGGWGWVVVVASFFCNFVVDGIIYSFGMLLPILVETFGESKAKVSLIGSLLSGSYLIAGPFASALANRFGFRRVTIIGAILSAIAFFLSSYAPNTNYLYMTFGILGGVGFGLIFVPAVITIGFYFEKWRALATGIAVCGSGIGTFVMAPISAWLFQHYGWRQTLVIQAGFILCCGFCGVLFRPLETMSVQVPVSQQTDPDDEDEISKERKPSLLLKTEVLSHLKGKGKSRSLLNVYEDLGITVEEINTKTKQKAYFNNNNKYPTASQILQLDVIADEESSANNSRGSMNKEVNSNFNNGTALMVLSNRELNVSTLQPPEIRERNKSASPEMLKRYSFAPEMRILLNRKYSLQPDYKSESFTASSTTTLASNKSNLFVRRHTDISNRPLYRDDIFFNANLKRLSQYTSQTSSLNYTMSVTRLPTYNDILEEKKEKFSILPEAIRRALATLLDTSLLKSYTFNVLAISGFLTSMGMYTPFVFINDRAITFGIEHSEALWLISVLGMANTIGRVGFGVLSSIPRMNAVLINNISLTLCGAFTIFSGVSPTPSYQFFYASVFGLTIACFSSLRTIIIVDLLGLEKLTNAFGLLLLFQGIAAVIGPPLAGFFVDVTRSYNLPFYISGALITLSAVICYPIEMLNNWERQRIKKDKKSSNCFS